jgi:L-rhamnose isomerase
MTIEEVYSFARERYAEYGVDTEEALRQLARIPISIHCWQGDDVGGFEGQDALEGAGLQATGNFPGKARTADELRMDFEKAISLIPGRHRFNLHAIYAETEGQKVDRGELQPEHFARWIDWANELKLGIDFNPTFFGHTMADGGFTLASHDPEVRKFWVAHGIACRKIAEQIGKALGTPSVCNIWIPDGYKDLPADRKTPRLHLEESLNAIMREKLSQQYVLDSVECKLFGLGSESYVVGSHEFYMGYAIRNDVMLCIDSGHFHPTENIADKISSLFTFVTRVLFHISRGVRWDSDHVVLLTDDVREIALELVRGTYLSRTHIGLDFFDASINRVAAWVIGTRNVIKALLYALLEPIEQLRQFEYAGDYTARLAMLEEAKTLPFGAVWDYYCLRHDRPSDLSWLETVKQYEKKILARRV